ncbi:MAG: CapA family protein [Chloroflexota bacterium]|nr:MAG: CapA family protein [Chloroflexota bacterium]
MKPSVRTARILLSFTLLGLGLLALISACRGQSGPLAEQSQSASINLPPTMVAKTTETPAMPVPTDTGTPVPTPPPTPVPTPTHWPQVRLFAPAHLTEKAAAAIQQMQAAGPTWNWRLIDVADSADVHLVAGDHGIPVGQRAVALTVPFTEDWEGVGASEAYDILANAREGVSIMDWAEMTPNRKALRVDGLLPHEPGYPLQQPWSLVALADFQPAAHQLARSLGDIIDHDAVIHLSAVGDLMLDRALGYAITSGDSSFPFRAVATELAQADITVGNLESALGDRGQPAAKSYTFRAPPAAADSLASAGFDLLTLANNHALDYGPEALIQAMELLAESEIAIVGAGVDEPSARRPVILEHMGLKIAFLGYVDVPIEVSGFDTREWSATGSTAGLAWADLGHIGQDVAAARQQADTVIVLLHSGHEYVQPPSPAQVEAAHEAVDAGADLVIGHHAHVLQGVEFRDDAVIAYGLGNFAFEIDGDPSTAILNVWLDTGGVRQLEFSPAIVQQGGQPRIATSEEATEIRRMVYYLTSLLNEAP